MILMEHSVHLSVIIYGYITVYFDIDLKKKKTVCQCWSI